MYYGSFGFLTIILCCSPALTYYCRGRSQCLRGLRRRSSVVRLLGLWARIPPGHGYMSIVYVVCCQSSLHLADDPSTGVPPNMACLNVVVEPRQVRTPWPTRGCSAIGGGVQFCAVFYRQCSQCI